MSKQDEKPKRMEKTLEFIQKRILIKTALGLLFSAIAGLLGGLIIAFEDSQSYYLRLTSLVLLMVVVGFFYIYFGKGEAVMDDLRSQVDQNKENRKPLEEQPLINQMKISLQGLGESQKATKTDVTEMQRELKKVIISLELEKDKIVNLITKKDLQDHVDHEISKATSRLKT